MSKKTPHLDLFGEIPVKPETRKEKIAKQKEIHLRSADMPGVTMERLWEEKASSYETKTLVHWNTSGPYGGDTKHAACGVALEKHEACVLVELVTCLDCRGRYAKAWQAMAMHARGLDEHEEESYD